MDQIPHRGFVRLPSKFSLRLFIHFGKRVKENSGEFGVWSLEWGVWSLEFGVIRILPQCPMPNAQFPMPRLL
ncbi:hypothetical protein [Nostoc sp.]|uniref:hypothetical protein n=1 Tax=Nostoc sp. TaxID=1180 RepID=UPI002FF71DD9